MKKLFKFIFILLFIVIITIVVPLTVLYFTISDTSDDAPIELYNEGVTIDGEISNLLERFTVNNANRFYLSFSEDNLDLLIFAIIRNTINPEYYNNECTADSCLAIQSMSLPDDVFLVGGRKLLIKHAYSELKDNNVYLYVTLDALGVKTKLSVGISFDETDDEYIFTLNKLGLGSLNLMSGFGKMIAQPILSAIGFTETEINEKISEKELPLTFDMDNFAFELKKEELGELVLKLMNEEDSSSALLSEFIKAITSSENDLLNLGLFDVDELRHLGIELNLEAIKTSAGESALLAAKIDEASQPFDVESFVTNKTQTFIINSLASEMKFTFVNSDFNRIIYDQTSGYEGLQYPDTLEEGEVPIFKATGILLEFTTSELVLKLVIEINGIETVIQITGDVETTENEEEVNIVLRDEMSLGDIAVSSSFLLEFIGDSLESMEAMDYDKETHTLKLSVATFTDLMGVGGPSTPLTIEKIRVINGGVEIFVEVDDPSLSTIISDAKDAINSLLESDFLDSSAFDVSDPAQEELIEELEEVLSSIADTLSDPEQELTPEDTAALVEVINNLNSENQEQLLEQIANGSASQDLEDLYDLLFGN